MAGIVSYGAYIPLRRLGKGTQGWRAQNEKAVAYYDEDSLTMAVAAAIDCMGDMNRDTIDGLYAASTTLPYKEKMAATTIACAADLRRDVLTMDCTDSLRSGTGALRMAVDTVKAGSAGQLLVTVSDCRLGPPRSEFDTVFGDGAAAFLIGDKDEAATIEASYSISDELLDVWRGDTARFVRTWEDRWVQEEGYLKVFPQVINEFFTKFNIKPGDITKACLYGPNPRRHGQMGKTLGFKPEQIQDPLFSGVGNTGTASALMMLVAALEDARAGDKILVATYGNGADVMLLQVTGNIKKITGKRGIKGHLKHKMIFPSYDAYLNFRHNAGDPESGGGLSASAIYRERDAIYPLRGTKCQVCGTIEYPPQRVCAKCHTKDKFDSFRLSDQRAVIYTRVLDYAAPVPGYDSPAVDLLIDWHVGGRANFALTDKRQKPEEVPMGMEVEMTFRKLRAAGGIHHYWWKAMPLRETWIHEEEK